MSDPTLKRASVHIAYRASDGYSHQVTFSNIGQMGRQPAPEEPILDALEELARLACLFGFEEAAKSRVSGAAARVAQWRKERGN